MGRAHRGGVETCALAAVLAAVFAAVFFAAGLPAAPAAAQPSKTQPSKVQPSKTQRSKTQPSKTQPSTTLASPTPPASAPTAPSAPATRVLVYVDDVTPANAALAADATALTSGLCAALGKDKRLDVMCAPDVRQILNFAATAAMVGTASGPTNALTERLDRTQLVVSSSLRKEHATFVLVLKGGPKAANASGAALYTDQPTVALERRADHQKGLLDGLAELATKAAAGLIAPVTNTGQPAEPPAPLEEQRAAGK